MSKISLLKCNDNFVPDVTFPYNVSVIYITRKFLFNYFMSSILQLFLVYVCLHYLKGLDTRYFMVTDYTGLCINEFFTVNTDL